MRIFLFLAFVSAVISLIVDLSATTFLGVGAFGWFIASFVGFLLNEFTSGPIV